MVGAVDGLLAQALIAKIIKPATAMNRQARNILRIFPPSSLSRSKIKTPGTG
jgi:hypothetical protein